MCTCDKKGTLPEVCDKTNGQCLCKPGYGGPTCGQCIADFTGFPDCKPCNCSLNGSAFTVCDVTGTCKCLSNFAGKLCDQCYPGYYQYPKCLRKYCVQVFFFYRKKGILRLMLFVCFGVLACGCDSHGTNGVTCSNEGVCQCKYNFGGDKCDRCRDGFYNYPTCEGEFLRIFLFRIMYGNSFK